MPRNLFPIGCFLLCACQDSLVGPELLLSHDLHGTVQTGSVENISNAIRQGCDLRVAWGSRGRTRPDLTIEHISVPDWVAVRNDTDVSVQISGFSSNLDVIGNPLQNHTYYEDYGGTEKIVEWRATIKPDGTFDAVWFYPHNGAFIARVPQKHPMKWFANCPIQSSQPLYPVLKNTNAQ